MEHLYSLENYAPYMVGQLVKSRSQPLPWFWDLETFWMQSEEWEGKYHIDRFCIFAKVAIGTMSKSCRFYSWNFLDKYGSTRSICFTISFEFGSREREWSILLIWFLFFLLLAKVSFGSHFGVNANAYDANDMVKC